MVENIIKIWKEKDIAHIEFDFTCGGDSMGDTTLSIFDNKGNLVEDETLSDYFDNEVYKNVEFYVNSDGHYEGEFGVVTITLDEEEEVFEYSKSSSSEWNESSENDEQIELTDDEAQFVREYVLNINGGDGRSVTNYKKDFILTDKQEIILNRLETKIKDFVEHYTPKGIEGEQNDWYTFTTNEDGKELELIGNMLTVTINKSFRVIKDDEVI